MRQEIAQAGAISFARFMELALYEPDVGYYERHTNQIGRKGDFFTNVSVGSLFGRLLACQFSEWLVEMSDEAGVGLRRSLGVPLWALAEAGAHDGRLAADLLAWFSRNRPELAPELAYWIIEPSARRRQAQAKAVRDFEEWVRWFSSWEEIPPDGFWGVIFSNELLDAFPVHRLGWDARGRTWFEWGVSWDGSRFVWTRLQEGVGLDARSIADQFWPELPEELLDVLPDGFTTEVSPAAVAWWRQAAERLQNGKLITFDYGITAEELFVPHRGEGTLRAYSNHRLARDVLSHPGEQDLTAHVNFTALRRAGEQAGLTTEFYGSQREFLVRIAEKAWAPDSGFGPWAPEDNRKFQTLVHPDHLGRAFKVLVQSRGGAPAPSPDPAHS